VAVLRQHLDDCVPFFLFYAEGDGGIETLIYDVVEEFASSGEVKD